MKVIGNFLWLICGGLLSAIGYFIGSLVLACTIVGIPFALQTFKLGFLCLWPFGAELKFKAGQPGCLSIFMNLLWFLFGGIPTMLVHLQFGLILCLTIVGIPWGLQHFKMLNLALLPFGREVNLNF